MRTIAITLFILCAATCLHAQDHFTQFHFSGLEVVIRQADTFSYKLAHPDRCRIRTEHGWLVIEVKNLKGKKPKSKIELYVTDVENLCVQNGTLSAPDTLNVEFLELEMVAASGEATLNAHYLHVNLDDGSRLTVEGNCDLVNLNARGATTLDAGKLSAEEGEAHVREEAQATACIQRVRYLFTDKGTFRNLCE